MSEYEQILWRRNKEITDENTMLIRALALVLISPDHKAAIQAAKDAFAQMEVSDPFKPVEVVQATDGVRKAS